LYWPPNKYTVITEELDILVQVTAVVDIGRTDLKVQIPYEIKFLERRLKLISDLFDALQLSTDKV
jgi:hypothetical protein